MMKKKAKWPNRTAFGSAQAFGSNQFTPPSLSPTQISSRLRLQTPQPAKRRGLTLRHVAAAAAALAS